MTSHYLTYQNSTVHYRKSGSGPHLTVCFHGFGEFAKTFDPVVATLHNHTLISLDLPFHGETIWREETELSINGLLQIISLCPEIGDSPFGLMGYSMGGRVVLSLFETVPEKINYIVLIAPDGLKANPWYLFATQTMLGKIVFRYTMKNPAWFNGLLQAGQKMGMVNESIMKFVQRYINDSDMRQKVYLVWTTMRKFIPNLNTVKSSIRKNNTPVYLIFGKYDRIIIPSFGESFVKNMEQWCRMEIIDAGHQVLHPRYADVIARALAYCTDHQNNQTV